MTQSSKFLLRTIKDFSRSIWTSDVLHEPQGVFPRSCKCFVLPLIHAELQKEEALHLFSTDEGNFRENGGSNHNLLKAAGAMVQQYEDIPFSKEFQVLVIDKAVQGYTRFMEKTNDSDVDFFGI